MNSDRLHVCRCFVFGLSVLIFLAVLGAPHLTRIHAAESAVFQRASLNTEALRARIDQRIEATRFGSARWGVLVVSLESGQVVYSHNENRLFIPASNTKLFTAALALDRLGPDFRTRTSLYSRERPDRQGRLRGDLLLVGRGDPSFALYHEPGTTGSTVKAFAQALFQSGVRSVRGQLLVDDHYFSESTYGAGWMVEDLDAYYCPEISALSLNDNVATWRVTPGASPGKPAMIQMVEEDTQLVWSNRVRTVAAKAKTRVSATRLLGQNRGVMSGTIALDSPRVTQQITVHDPALWFGRSLAMSLRTQGVSISGRVRESEFQELGPTGEPGPTWQQLTTLESPPLRSLLATMMKPSNNLHAQLLFLLVGAQGEKSPEALTTPERSVAAMDLWMRGFLGAGVLPHLEEGAGLSRRNGASPRHIVELLRYMDKHSSGAEFKESLPIAGVDGTLKHRMRGTRAEGNLRAKTGSLRSVSSLSGYVISSGGERLAFSILLNDYVPESGQPSARDEVDAIAALLADLARDAKP